MDTQVLEENETTDAARQTARPTVRATGSTSSGSPRRARATKQNVLSQETMRRLGRSIAGHHWQADVAGMMEVSKSQMTRWIRQTRSLPPTMNILFQQVLIDKIIELASNLTAPGMVVDDNVVTSQRQIIEAADRLKVKRKTP